MLCSIGFHFLRFVENKNKDNTGVSLSEVRTYKKTQKRKKEKKFVFFFETLSYVHTFKSDQKCLIPFFVQNAGSIGPHKNRAAFHKALRARKKREIY